MYDGFTCMRGLFFTHLIIQVSDDLHVQCETYRPRFFYIPAILVLDGNRSCARHVPREHAMCCKHNNEKKLIPVDYGAMMEWLKTKGEAIAIENLGGGGPHWYEAKDNLILIDNGKGKLNEEMWKKVCRDMVVRISPNRLNRASEYSNYRFFVQAPSIPVLCWAFCEEFLNNNKV